MRCVSDWAPKNPLKKSSWTVSCWFESQIFGGWRPREVCKTKGQETLVGDPAEGVRDIFLGKRTWEWGDAADLASMGQDMEHLGKNQDVPRHPWRWEVEVLHL